MKNPIGNPEINVSMKIGPLFPKPKPSWPMYSFDQPSYILWGAIAEGLTQRGWNTYQIRTYLQSKQTRWDLDGELGEALRNLGKKWVDAEVHGWDLP